MRRLWIGLALAAVWLAWLIALPPRPESWLVVFTGAPLVVLGSWAASRGEPWRASVRRTADLHALAAMLLVALAVQFEDTHGITTDGVIYFSQLRSVLFDGDLDVAAEFAFLGQPPRPSHVVPIGPTLVWLPLYLAVAAAESLGRAIGWCVMPADPAGVGLTMPYVRAALVSSLAIGGVGLFVLLRYLGEEFGRATAFAATLLTFAGTPLVWYMVYEPAMTHAASFGFVAIFVVLCTRWASTAISARQAMILGVVLGLAVATRPQEALFALFPACLLLTSAGTRRGRVRAGVRMAGWGLIGAAPFLIAQAVHSAILLNRETFAVVGSNGYLDLLHSHWADTLWSSWHGFLSWTPIAYVALIGTLLYCVRGWRWTMASLAVISLMAWVNGSTADWAAGWSFGGRRFISCLVLLAPGLAFLIHRLVLRPMVAIALLSAAVIGWNQLLLAQYRGGMLDPAVPTSFAQIVRQQALVLTRPPFFYPFAFPANAWFAWQTGLPIDRYDLLAPEPLHASMELTFDANAGKYLLAGWGARAADLWGDLRWMDAARAEVVLPLAVPANRPIDVAVVARTRLLDPPVRVSLALAVNGRRVGSFAPESQQPSTVTMQVAPGVFIRGYNRLVFEKIESVEGSPPVAFHRLSIR